MGEQTQRWYHQLTPSGRRQIRDRAAEQTRERDEAAYEQAQAAFSNAIEPFIPTLGRLEVGEAIELIHLNTEQASGVGTLSVGMDLRVDAKRGEDGFLQVVKDEHDRQLPTTSALTDQKAYIVNHTIVTATCDDLGNVYDTQVGVLGMVYTGPNLATGYEKLLESDEVQSAQLSPDKSLRTKTNFLYELAHALQQPVLAAA